MQAKPLQVLKNLTCGGGNHRTCRPFEGMETPVAMPLLTNITADRKSPMTDDSRTLDRNAPIDYDAL